MRRVIKLGGSLFLRRDFASQVENWLNRQQLAANYVFCGGGRFVDAMRELDAIHALNQRLVHWRCIELLQLTFQVMQELFPAWETIATPHHLQQLVASPDREGNFLIGISAFYAPKLNNILPHSWDVTSDTLAGLLAERIGADELVLLKSCPIPPGLSLAQMADQEIVDPFFPQICCSARNVRIENLPAEVAVARSP